MILTIEKLIYGGNGLARTPPDANGRSMAVFIPFVLPGEHVEADIRQEKPAFARGTMTRLIEPAANRIQAACPHFGQCGGCHYQHIDYERQLEFKAGILRESLQRIAKINLGTHLQIHPSPQWNYRNRTRLRMQTGGEFALGYYRLGSHQFLPIARCPISSPLISQSIERLLEGCGAGCPSEIEEIELFANSSDTTVLAWAYCRPQSDPAALRAWAERIQQELPSLSGMTFFRSRKEDDDAPELRPITHTGETGLTYHVASDRYHVDAGAFFQVNRHLLEDLVQTVTAGPGGASALDLYAGVGLFSLPLARVFHHIFAVEASQLSLAGLRKNVPANVKAVRARTEDHLRSRATRQRPDLIVVDPPRAGLGTAVTRGLIDLAAPRLRYVSCDPATLARDLAPLLASGYRIEEAHLFDLFPQTFHIESVMLLAR